MTHAIALFGCLLLIASQGASAQSCETLQTLCTQGPETRYIDTYPVYRDCWQFKTVERCEMGVTVNHCESLENNAACELSDSHCLASPKPGVCTDSENTYRCEAPIEDSGENITSLPVDVSIDHRFDEAKHCEAATLSTCSETERLCTRPDETQIVDGVPVTLPCWEETLTYSCLTKPANPSCGLLETAGCRESQIMAVPGALKASETNDPFRAYACHEDLTVPEHEDIAYLKTVPVLDRIEITEDSCSALAHCPIEKTQCQQTHPVFTDVCLSETQPRRCEAETNACEILQKDCELKAEEPRELFMNQSFKDFLCESPLDDLPDAIESMGVETVNTGMNEINHCPTGITSPTRTQTCAESDRVCTEGPETRLINGESIYKDCWKWSIAYGCNDAGQNPTVNTCLSLEADARCELQNETCLAQAPTGCSLFNRTYSCEVSPETVIEKEECTESVCLYGLCTPTDEKPNDNLTDAVAKLEVGRQAAVYGDYEKLRFFNGEAQRCANRLGGVSCCKGKVKGGYTNREALGLAYTFGIEAASETVKTLGSSYVSDILAEHDTLAPLLTHLYGEAALGAYTPSFSYYGLSVSVVGGNLAFSFNPATFAALVALDVASDYLSCTADEQALQLKRGANLCLYVGSACTDYQMGLCQTKTETYCCYHSQLAKLIHEEAAKQLGLTENPTSPTCRGLTAQEFARLDLSRIPLDELKKAMGTQLSPATDAEHVRRALLRAEKRKSDLDSTNEPYAAMPGKTGVIRQ